MPLDIRNKRQKKVTSNTNASCQINCHDLVWVAWRLGVGMIIDNFVTRERTVPFCMLELAGYLSIFY